MNSIPVALILSLAVQVFCQIIKTVGYSVKEKRVNLHYLISAGGMPSSHTAFVSALTTSIGVSSGITSEVFAVAAVFSLIIIYDAYRLRGHVEAQAKAINRLLKHIGRSSDTELSEMAGHSPAEIAVGLIIGIAIAAPLTFLLTAQ